MGTPLAPLFAVAELPPPPNWETERHALLAQRISDIGLEIRGTLLEKLRDQLYLELSAKGLQFKPPVYLSDQWGCPDGTPLIGVPFYLADPRLSRIEEDFSVSVESETDSMRFLRHEAGHAFNYAYRLYDRGDWRKIFGPYSRPYRERYRPNPFSRNFVRHILGWYAQKHPDEDFAETFAVWLTPDIDWRREYDGSGALAKLEYMDAVMREVAHQVPEVPEPSEDDLPVSAMQYTVADHYKDAGGAVPLRDPRIFDGDLRTIFAEEVIATDALSATEFIARHRREIVTRISYWTGENGNAVRQFVDFLSERSAELRLKAAGLEASILIELTAFGTAVIMNYRYTNAVDRSDTAN
ncbi:MAG: putative zinc-binding metallopeptidase [Gemmatimonadota bacterium]|nr:putative zinc-binding metallopeptidase [Gemmatimonadota bacterium]